MSGVYASQVVETYVYGELLALPSVVATFGENVFVEDAKPGTPFPYLVVGLAAAPEEAKPIGRGLSATAWTFDYDFAGWYAGVNPAAVLEAMEAIDGWLAANGGVTFATPGGSFLISSFVLGEMPKAPPGRPGDKPRGRLGKTYHLFVSRAG